MFGPRWWLWWLPLGPPSNGLEFEVSQVIKERVQNEGQKYIWPPLAYLQYKARKRANQQGSMTEETLSEDEDVDEMENEVPRSNTPPALRQRKQRIRKALKVDFVGRGSEGYEVREYSEQERVKMFEVSQRAFEDGSASSFGESMDSRD